MSVERPPEQRIVGNCRQFSVLTVALLRRNGLPARARAGFADYFEPGKWTDHWVVERWDPETTRWVRTDAQIDQTQQQLLGLDFEPVDLPPGRFRTGAEAWQYCRIDGADSNRFGIDDMHGEWFIAGSTIRDLAALNKMELHTWDVWGTIDDLAFRELTNGEREHIDHIASTIQTGDLTDIQALYETDGLEAAEPITSARTQQPVQLPR